MNRILLLTIAISAVGIILVAIAACKTSRAGYETATYSPVSTDGAFEIRDYAQLTLIEAPMKSSGENGAQKDGNRSFGSLFGYITGENSDNQKIAMTTPVFMTESKEAPGNQRNMAFVMPASMTADSVPQPTDKKLSVRSLPPARYAVYRFSGGRSAKREAEALENLQTWMTARNLPALSSPIYGYFDPPWTPGPLRRNEVMVKTSAPGSKR